MCTQVKTWSKHGALCILHMIYIQILSQVDMGARTIGLISTSIYNPPAPKAPSRGSLATSDTNGPICQSGTAWGPTSPKVGVRNNLAATTPTRQLNRFSKKKVRGNHHTTRMTASRTSTSSGLRLRSHSQQGSTIQWSPAAMIVDVGDPSAPTNQANEIITLHLQDHVLRFFRQLRRGPEVPQSELYVCRHSCPQNASTSSWEESTSTHIWITPGHSLRWD